VPQEAGIFRLELQDSWTAREFARLLETIDTSYRLIWVVLEDEDRGFPFARFFDDISLFDRIDFLPLILSDKRPWLGPSLAQTVRIRRVHVASPGYIEVTAAVAILGLIAEFITAWRSENTRRSAIKAAADIGEKQIAADLLKAVLDAKRSKHRDQIELTGPASGLLKIVEKLLIDVAKDRRIRKVSSRPAEETKARR
jgi:hypothetical protein